MTSSDPVLPTDQPDTHGDTRPRVSRRLAIPLAVAYLGPWIAFVPPGVLTLQVRVAELAPENRAGSLSLIVSVAAVFGIVAMPVVGRLSDRTVSRWGMRRPWLVGLSLVGLAGLVLVAFAGSIALLLIGWCISIIVFNSILAVMLALVPDQVPAGARGRISGILGVGQALATVLGVAFVSALTRISTATAILLPGIVGLGCTLVATLLIKDRVLDARDRPAFGLRQLVRSYALHPRRDPDFGWAWLSRFAFFMTLAVVQTYQVFYLTAQLGLAQSTATAIVAAGLGTQIIMVVIVSIVVGPLSDRLRRRKIFVLASAVAAGVGALVLAFSTALPTYFLAMVLIGVGQGIYVAVDLALVADVLPDRETDAAKNLGVFTVANLLPQSLAPAIAPALLAIAIGSLSSVPGNNYVMLFVAGAIFAAISALTIRPIRSVR